jgi:hypothetical protein
MRAAPLALLGVIASFAGCGGDDDGGGGDGAGPERPTGSAIVWLDARGGAGEREVRIGYETDPCTRARRAVVAEEEDTVTITLLDPERNPREECIQLAKPGCARVALEAPLAGRRVVDGAPGAFPPRIRRQDTRPFRVFGRCRPVPVEG